MAAGKKGPSSCPGRVPWRFDGCDLWALSHVYLVGRERFPSVEVKHTKHHLLKTLCEGSVFQHDWSLGGDVFQKSFSPSTFPTCPRSYMGDSIKFEIGKVPGLLSVNWKRSRRWSAKLCCTNILWFMASKAWNSFSFPKSWSSLLIHAWYGEWFSWRIVLSVFVAFLWCETFFVDERIIHGGTPSSPTMEVLSNK